MHPSTIQHPGEPAANAARAAALSVEPKSLRTFTPTQAVVARSAGVFHWTPDGRRLYDFTSGVLVSNLGHNPERWMERFCSYMGWPHREWEGSPKTAFDPGPLPVQVPEGYFPGVAMTTYNAVTPLEAEAGKRLVACLQARPGGKNFQQVMWAASGSEAIQKALWTSMARDRNRPMILATRYGFHGKKGLSNAITGSEVDPERDPRVKFFGFPMQECRDLSLRDEPFDPAPYRKELDALWHQYGMKLGTLITEPYLGGGGSYHPPKAYLRMLQDFCREKEIVFILDEVQANFGRTGDLFAYETYGIEPDMVVLGKGLGNGVPVAAVVGRTDLFAAMEFGEGSDTWSANPLSCTAVLATLDEFETKDILGPARQASQVIEAGLVALKKHPFVAHVRGEHRGMVWGVEFRDHGGRTGPEWAAAFVLHAYRQAGDGVHLLGPLSKKVVRISPPLVITVDEAQAAMDILAAAAERMAQT
jgi:4-aminobutyrate aminotransferase-like enzyme